MTDTITETPPQKPMPEALGATRIAHLVAEHTGKPVVPADIEQLVEDGHLISSGDSLLNGRVERDQRGVAGGGVACVLGATEGAVLLPDCQWPVAIHRRPLAGDLSGRAPSLRVSIRDR